LSGQGNRRFEEVIHFMVVRRVRFAISPFHAWLGDPSATGLPIIFSTLQVALRLIKDSAGPYDKEQS
jgi:hypothetical protein